MPILQIDGEAIATIDDRTSKVLLRLAQAGTGKVRDKYPFIPQNSEERSRPPTIEIELTLDFPGRKRR
jgi:hypothetical protein